MKKANRSTNVNIDNLGQVVVSFPDGKSIMITDGDKKNTFKIRTLDYYFLIRMTGAVNVIEVEMRRLGK